MGDFQAEAQQAPTGDVVGGFPAMGRELESMDLWVPSNSMILTPTVNDSRVVPVYWCHQCQMVTKEEKRAHYR